MDILQNHKPRTRLQSGLTPEYTSYILLLLYIFTMPFVSAFSFTGTISLPLIFASILFVLMIARLLLHLKSPQGFLGFDIIIIFLFLFFCILSFLVNGWGNVTSFNHTVAYISTFLLFYVSIKFTLFSIPDKNLLLKRVLQFVTYTTILSAVYGTVEFISSNIFGVNLNNYTPRPGVDTEYYTPVVLSLFYRSRGFAYESGVYTQMLELFAPLSVYYFFDSGFCKWKKSVKIFFTVTMLLGIIFAASSASFIAIPIAIIFSALIYGKKLFHFFITKSVWYYLRAMIVLLIIFLVNNYFSVYNAILLSITEKLDSFSMEDRQDRINFFFNEFSRFTPLKKVIGGGPAATDLIGVDGSHVVISLYYNVTFELGFIGLFLLILLIAYIFFNTITIRSKIGFFLNVSLISGIIHYYVVHDFWVPWFWFIGVFSIFVRRNFNISE